MIRHIAQSTLTAGLSLALLCGCSSAPVKVDDGRIEKPLVRATGFSTEDLEKIKNKSTWSLWDVYTLAVERTSSLANAAENIEQADAQGFQAIGAVLPQISLAGSKSYQATNYVGPGASSVLGSGIPGASLYLTGTQTILTGLNEIAGIAGAQATKDFQEYSLRDRANTLLLDIARTYYSALELEETLQSKQTSLELTEKILAQLKNWQAVGRSRASEVLSAQAQLSRLSADILGVRNQLIQAREQLTTLSRVKADQPLRSEETYSIPSFALSEVEPKVEDLPVVKAARASVGIADAYLIQAHGGHAPSLSVQGNYYLDKEGGFPSPEWNVQLIASLPLFQGGQVVAQERIMASRKRQAEMVLARTRRSARGDIRESYQSLVNCIEETEAYRKALEAAEAEYKAVTADYRNSLVTNLEVLRTLDSLEETKTNYARAKYQALYNQIWLGVATGELPKTSEKEKHD